MCQPLGTNVTAVCRLPHAKAITGQIILYLLREFQQSYKMQANKGAWSGGLNPVALAGLQAPSIQHLPVSLQPPAADLWLLELPLCPLAKVP
jgi:hypothetical protein